MLELRSQDDVTEIRMAHGKASALDLELCDALTRAVTDAAPGARALVLTGTGRIFSAGVDLPRLLREGPEYRGRFLDALSRAIVTLFECERPVVAAVNGHAIAGGCILAAACDWRLMVDTGATIGVPELAVGVPFPVAALEVVRCAVGDAGAARLVVSHANLPPADAAACGLVHRLVPPAELESAALAEARRLAAIPAVSFALAKRALRAPASERIRATRSLDDEVTRAWQGPDVRGAIAAYVDATLGKARPTRSSGS